MRYRADSRTLVLLGALLVAVTACGGDGTGGVVDETEDQTQSSQPADSGDSASDEGSGECTIGPIAGDDSFCTDALIPELAVVPLPDSVDQIGVGSPDVGDGRASQDVYFTAEVSEVAAFYTEALADAGFEVTLNEGNDQAVTIEFTDPDGRSGSLLVRTAGTHPSQMSIQMRLD